MIQTTAGDLSYILFMLQPVTQVSGGALDNKLIHFYGEAGETPTIHAYNRHMSITLDIMTDDSEDLEALVDHSQLYNLIKNHDDEDEILLDFSDDRQLVVTSPEGKYYCRTTDTSTYQRTKINLGDHIAVFDEESLNLVIQGASNFLPKSRVAGMMSALHMYFNAEKQRVGAATRDHGVASYFVTDANVNQDMKLVIMGNQMAKVKNFPGEDNIHLYLNDAENMVIFEGEYGVLGISTMTDSDVSVDSYLKHMIKPRADHIETDRKLLKKALNRLGSWDMDNILFHATNNGLILEGQDKIQNRGKENPLDADISEDLKLYITTDLSNKLLKVSNEEKFRIDIDQHTSSAVVSGKDGELDYYILFSFRFYSQ